MIYLRSAVFGKHAKSGAKNVLRPNACSQINTQQIGQCWKPCRWSLFTEQLSDLIGGNVYVYLMSYWEDLDDQLRWLEPSDLNLEYMGVSHLDCVTRVLSCNGPIVAGRDCGIKPAWC